MKIAAVVPAYNEEAVIGSVIEKLRPYVDEVIVVDDGSRDATSQQAKQAGAFVFRHPINRGQGAALQTGTRAALERGADIVVHFDADGQHDVLDIERMVEPLRDRQVDVVLGSRFLGSAPNLPRSRWVILKLGLLFTRVFSGLTLTDPQNGFRALSRDAAQRIVITQNGMAHASEILDQIASLGLRFREVPITIHYTAYSLARGQKNSNALRIVWRLIADKFFQ